MNLYNFIPFFRKSVIVSTKNVQSQTKQEEFMIIAINIKEIENMYASEEQNYVGKLSYMFNETWQEVCLGENFISRTVDLHKDGAGNPNRAQLTQQIFNEVNMQLRYMKSLNMSTFLLLFQRACFAFPVQYGRYGHHPRPSSSQTAEKKPWLCPYAATDHLF